MSTSYLDKAGLTYFWGKIKEYCAPKATAVTGVAWDSTNKKLTKTINGSTTDVVTAATLRTGLNVADGAEVNQNAFSNVKVGSTTVAADSKTDTLELVAGNNVIITTDASNDTVTIAASGGGSGESIPAGVISPFAGSTAPTNWLLCDGSAVSRTTYSALFAVIGTTYGTGDGSTTFNLPNFQGRVPVGTSGSHALGSSGGAETVTLDVTQIPSHEHNGASYYDNIRISNGPYPAGSGGGQALNTAGGGNHSIKTAATGGGQAHDNMQPYLTVNYIIHI